MTKTFLYPTHPRLAKVIRAEVLPAGRVEVYRLHTDGRTWMPLGRVRRDDWQHFVNGADSRDCFTDWHWTHHDALESGWDPEEIDAVAYGMD